MRNWLKLFDAIGLRVGRQFATFIQPGSVSEFNASVANARQRAIASYHLPESRRITVTGRLRLMATLLLITLATDFGVSEAHACGATPVTDLPMADGKTFATLDDYLAHLKVLGAMDLPYYEQVGPDRYQRIAGRGSGTSPQFFTRSELLKKYGFSC